MTRCISLASVAALACCSAALAQAPYAVESQLRFEVWNGSAWSGSTIARPGERVEVRAVVSYTGSNPSVRGLGEILYQPTLSNADNEGPSQDSFGAWRNNGRTGFGIPGSLLSTSEGASAAPLSTYGRVGFGGTGSTDDFQNVHTTFRHTNGSNGAPQGSFLRAAGSFVQQWPIAGDTSAWTVNDSNRFGRGISAMQLSEISPVNQSLNPNWQGGTTDIVIFRQAVLLSDLGAARVLDLTSDQSFLYRVGRHTSNQGDNRRYMTWWTTPSGPIASYRVGVDIVGAQIIVSPNIPAPGALALLGLGACATRRRRSR